MMKLSGENPTRTMPKGKFPYIHRDISWLSFNYRVLQEAKDPSVPLLERLKFLAIFSSNLDEFFRVRVANIRSLLRVGKKTRQEIYYDPKVVLKQILKIVNRQQEEVSQIFEREIVPELNKHKVFLKRRLELNKRQRLFVEDYFNGFMLPYVQPVLLVKGKIRPFLNNASLYLTIVMRDKDDHHHEQFAIVKIPSDHLPRFIQLPSVNGRKEVIMLDDIVRHCLSLMFPGYEIHDTYSIKLTRDAELYIDDEFQGDLIAKIKTGLTKRQVGSTSRFVYDREIPKDLLRFLTEMFSLKEDEFIVEGRYHNNFDFFKFPDFGLKHLKNAELPPLPHPLEEAKDIFALIREGDQLIAPPYHSYKSVVKFFEDAATDPKVTHIQITQYRVAKRSRIMEALMEAAEAGKKVFVFIEVKARFDEEANLAWGEQLEAAGVKVHYSLPGVKVHSKLGLVRRKERGGFKDYAYLSTGNFHEETAKIYGDFGLFTADLRLTSEMLRLFDFLATTLKPRRTFRHLLVGRFGMREKLEKLIDREIAFAKKGKPASMFIKINSIQDERMIEKLYDASKAGVKIRMVVRGICSLVPGVRGISENIEVISIVDRYLEHARAFIFNNGGKEEVYLSSADWMVHNLSFRVEAAFRIYDEKVSRQIRDVMQLQWQDTVKARLIDEAHTNAYRQNGSAETVQSQVETYQYFKKLNETHGTNP